MCLKICDIGYHHPFTGWLSYLMVIGIIWHQIYTMPCQIIWSTTHITNHCIIYVSYRNNDLRGIAFTKYNYIEYAWWRLSPITPTKIIESKWHDIIWSTTRHDQLSYQIWKLSDQRTQRNCIHKVKQDYFAYIPPTISFEDRLSTKAEVYFGFSRTPACL
jgi:hypothetical protein